MIKFETFGETYFEWFGAVGDGATNDYAAMLRALKAGTTLDGGIRILFNQQKTYLITAAAGIPGVLLDADNLPDATVAAANNEELPVFELVGIGNPGRFNPSGNAPAGGLKFTGTGDGIYIHGTTRIFRGQIKVENLNILGGTSGTRVADNGITLDKGSLKNTIRNVTIAYFTGDGFLMPTSGGTSSNILEDISSYYNDGWGFNILCNEMEFVRCKAARNGAGGIYFQSAVDVRWIGGASSHNYQHQIRIDNSERLGIDIYMEGQIDGNCPYVAPDGTGLGMVYLKGDAAIHSTSLKFRTHHAEVLGGTLHYEQYVVEIDPAAVIVGLDLDILATSGFDDANADQMYIVGPVSTATLSKCSLSTGRQGSVGDFADTDTEEAFQMVRSSFNDQVRIKSMLPFSVHFQILNITDNTPNQTPYMGPSATAANIQFRPPWDCSLVGFSIDSDIGAGTVRVTEGTTGLDETLTFATDGTSKEYTYDVGAKDIADGTSFNPLVSTSTLGATPDIDLIFYFAIKIYDQDK